MLIATLMLRFRLSQESLLAVVANVLNCDIVMREFEIQSGYLINFPLNWEKY